MCRCRFANCRHKHEPGCMVRGAWERYPFYLQLLTEVGHIAHRHISCRLHSKLTSVRPDGHMTPPRLFKLPVALVLPAPACQRCHGAFRASSTLHWYALLDHARLYKLPVALLLPAPTFQQSDEAASASLSVLLMPLSVPACDQCNDAASTRLSGI